MLAAVLHVFACTLQCDQHPGKDAKGWSTRHGVICDRAGRFWRDATYGFSCVSDMNVQAVLEKRQQKKQKDANDRTKAPHLLSR